MKTVLYILVSAFQIFDETQQTTQLIERKFDFSSGTAVQEKPAFDGRSLTSAENLQISLFHNDENGWLRMQTCPAYD